MIGKRNFNPNDFIKEKKFFCYSGDDGDLYRKRGIPGYRISIYPHVWSIQKNIKTGWNKGWYKYKIYRDTGYDSRDFISDDKVINTFKEDINNLINNKSL